MGDDFSRRRVISKKQSGYIIYEMNGLMHGCGRRKGGFSFKNKRSSDSIYKEIVEYEAKKGIEEKNIQELNKRIEDLEN